MGSVQSPGSRRAGWGTHGQLRHIIGGEFQQWYIVASPGHPYLAAVIEAVLSSINRFNSFAFDNAWEAAICTTGPIMYTRSVHPLLADHPHRRLYRDYRKAESPLVRQPFPLSLLWPLLTLDPRAARRLRGLLRR